jgi:chromosome segregation ATPase
MLRREDEGEAGEDDARRASVETRRLARKCEALERAVAKLKKDNVELEREVIEGRSAWFDEARRELDAALRRGAKSTSTSKSARETELERRCAMLQTQNNELRAEAIALEEDVVHAERVASKLQKENAVLLQATRAAKEEFKRLERRSKDSHRHGSDHSTVATLQRKVESMAGTIGELSRMNAHLARDSSTSSRPSAAAATVFSCMANLQDTEEDKRQSAPSSPMRRMSEIERAMETVQLKSPNMSTSSPRLPAYLGSPFGNSVASIARSPLR